MLNAGKSHGLIDNWLRHIKDIYFRYQERFASCVDEEERIDLMCEYNVVEQVANICHTTIPGRLEKRSGTNDTRLDL